jgi:hypothetical protein
VLTAFGTSSSGTSLVPVAETAQATYEPFTARQSYAPADAAGALPVAQQESLSSAPHVAEYTPYSDDGKPVLVEVLPMNAMPPLVTAMPPGNTVCTVQ